MKSKRNLLFIFFSTAFCLSIYSRVEPIDYFGENLPGNNPESFEPNIIDTLVKKYGDYQERIVFSKDGESCYFHFINYADPMGRKIISTFKKNTIWTSPQPSFVSNDHRGEDITISPTGDTILFIKISMETESYDIHMSLKNGDDWSEPVILSSPVNSGFLENQLCYTNSGNLYFGSDRDGGYAIYRTNLSAESPTIEKIKDMANEEFYVSPDESYIILGSGEKYNKNLGVWDVFVTFKKEDETWTYPKNLGDLYNSARFEYAPSISPDGLFIFYTTDGTNGNSDIKWFSTSHIETLKNSNFTPYLKSKLIDQTDTIGNHFSYTIPDTIFIDDDGNETLTLSARISNGNELPDSLRFYSETNTLSGTLNEAGSFNIKVIATDTEGESVSDIFRLRVKENPVGINEISAHDNLIVYPNPARNKICIESAIYDISNSYYKILGFTGTSLLEGYLSSKSIDISELITGTYMLQLKAKTVLITKKIVVK